MKDSSYRKLEIECSKCKAKFQIWIEDNHFASELEKRIRENFHKYCPVCKALEGIDKESNI